MPVVYSVLTSCGKLVDFMLIGISLWKTCENMWIVCEKLSTFFLCVKHFPLVKQNLSNLSICNFLYYIDLSKISKFVKKIV